MKKLLIALVVLALLAGTSVWFLRYSAASAVSVTPSSTFSEDKLFDLTNKWREEVGLPTYKKDEQLCDSARIRVEQIKTNWSHDGFEADWICKNQDCSLGENLIKETTNEKDALTSWILSPHHLENLIDPKFKYMCVVYSDGYAVMHFGDRDLY